MSIDRTDIDRTETDSFVSGLADFVTESPSSWHAAAAVAKRLDAAGFHRFDEAAQWTGVAAGTAGYVIRDGAIIAWKLGAAADGASPVRTLGAHSDSPGFLVKPQAQFDFAGWSQVGVEVYGGPLLNSWFDRDLAFAGRLVDRQGREHLVETAPFARIPRLAIHLDRGVNAKLEIDKQRHLQPVIGMAGADFEQIIADAAGLPKSEIVGSDLVLADKEPPARIGAAGELFASARMDNLSSVYAGLDALLATDPADTEIAVLAVFDHEEVGSDTRAGAGGPLYTDVIERLQRALGADDAELARSRSQSWVLSADAGHSIHPNYFEKHDPNVQPLCGQGPMLKLNAQQRYTSDAHGKALWTRLGEAAGVQTQVFVSNNEMPCGSTIGPITATRTGVRTLDVGIPLLSMHSVRELAHVADLVGLRQISAAFFAGR